MIDYKDYIACCGCYCKACKAFIDNSCKGCKLGYSTNERDINKAKCKIKICCLKEKKLTSCAECKEFNDCKTFNSKFKIGTRNNKKCIEILNFIKDKGYDEFLLRTKTWTNHTGKLK